MSPPSSRESGATWLQKPPSEQWRSSVRSVARANVTTWNVLAETAGGNPNRVVMAGAHLDSVPSRPGIDDNGTGSVALLAAAQQLAGSTPVNKVRFAWWGAEELGLKGSTHYLDELASKRPGDLDALALYLNFDMIGSDNFARFVYDGGNSDFPKGSHALGGPPGSGAVGRVFRDYFAARSLAFKETPLDGRGDYRAFIKHGVPVGGLFTGAERAKTRQEEAVYGGKVGAPYDDCYHRSCDRLQHVNRDAVEQVSAAVTYAIRTLATQRSLFNAP